MTRRIALTLHTPCTLQSLTHLLNILAIEIAAYEHAEMRAAPDRLEVWIDEAGSARLPDRYEARNVAPENQPIPAAATDTPEPTSEPEVADVISPVDDPGPAAESPHGPPTPTRVQPQPKPPATLMCTCGAGPYANKAGLSGHLRSATHKRLINPQPAAAQLQPRGHEAQLACRVGGCTERFFSKGRRQEHERDVHGRRPWDTEPVLQMAYEHAATTGTTTADEAQPETGETTETGETHTRELDEKPTVRPAIDESYGDFLARRRTAAGTP